MTINGFKYCVTRPSTSLHDIDIRDSKQFNKAQIRLNTLVVADSTPYIPFSQGELRSQVDFPHGISGDEVRWYAPYAHYQYKGELYLAANGSSYAQNGEVKYPTGRPLTYNNSGGADYSIWAFLMMK